MSAYLSLLPKKPSFSQKGLKGFQFPLSIKKFEIYFVDVSKGHDTYIISKKITHTYYILQGKGTFDISGKITRVKKGMMISVPPKIEYTYSGFMKFLLIMNPPWFEGNEIVTKKNLK